MMIDVVNELENFGATENLRTSLHVYDENHGDNWNISMGGFGGTKNPA